MAKWNGVKEYDAAGTSVVTGCTSLPFPMKTYCALHEGEPTPVADNVSSRTRKSLRDYKDKIKLSENAGQDHVYIIFSSGYTTLICII